MTRSRTAWAALVATLFAVASVSAEERPLDITDPTPRGIFVALETSSDPGVVGAAYDPSLPATYSATGGVGTVVIPVSSHEQMRAGFLTPIPDSFTPIVIEIDLSALTATSQSASGLLENGPLLQSIMQGPLGTETTAGYMNGGDIFTPIFCTSQADVDQACMTIPAFCGATCFVVPGVPYDVDTGQLNLVGSESQEGCDGALCSGPFILFSQHGDLRLTEAVVEDVPILGPGAFWLLAALIVTGACLALRRAV